MGRRTRNPGELSPRMAELMALADGTRTWPEVAAAMGITVGGVSAWAGKARKEGLNPRFLARPMGGARPNTGRRGPRLPKPATLPRPPKLPRVRLDLPPDVARWFVGQIPAGGTADDLVRGFIIDAFNEEVGP